MNDSPPTASQASVDLTIAERDLGRPHLPAIPASNPPVWKSGHWPTGYTFGSDVLSGGPGDQALRRRFAVGERSAQARLYLVFGYMDRGVELLTWEAFAATSQNGNPRISSRGQVCILKTIATTPGSPSLSGIMSLRVRKCPPESQRKALSE